MSLLLPFEPSLATSSQTFHLSIHQYSSSLRLSLSLAESGTVTKSLRGPFSSRSFSTRIAKRTAKGTQRLAVCRIRFVTRSLCMRSTLRHSSQPSHDVPRKREEGVSSSIKKKKETKKSTKIIFIHLLCSAWMTLLFFFPLHPYSHALLRAHTDGE